MRSLLSKKLYIINLLRDVPIPWKQEKHVCYLAIVSEDNDDCLRIDESLNLLGFISLCIKFLTNDILLYDRNCDTVIMEPEGDYTVEQAFIGLKDPSALITFKEEKK